MDEKILARYHGPEMDMICVLADYSRDREAVKELKIKFIREGVDVTEEAMHTVLGDKYLIKLVNPRGEIVRLCEFETREKANMYFKTIRKGFTKIEKENAS